MKIEITIFIIIPLITIIFFFLPVNIKNMLKVDLSEFNIPTFYTAIFIHEDFSNHFLPNIIAYYLYTSLSYCFSKLSRKNIWFTINLYIFFLILPSIAYPLLICINKFYFHDKLPPSCGFSGIISALIGLTPISILAYLKNSKVLKQTDKPFISIFLASILLIPYIYRQPFIPITIIFLLIISIWINRENLKAIYKHIKKTTIQNFGLCFLTILSIPSYFIGILGMFPTQIVYKSSIIDIISHYLGWIIGFFLSYVLLKIDN